jgi:hypothetical protein
VLMIMQLNVKFEKEQNGTLFVRKGQWLGPFGEGGGQRDPTENSGIGSSRIILPSCLMCVYLVPVPCQCKITVCTFFQ